MRISARGRVTIPEEIRRQAGLLPHSEVEIEFDGEGIRIVPRIGRHFPTAPLLSPEEVRALLGGG
jgi:AbrB family looped-hinge helix DNA binding protein